MTPTPEALAKEITRQLFVEGCSLGHANQIILEAFASRERAAWKKQKADVLAYLDALSESHPHLRNAYQHAKAQFQAGFHIGVAQMRARAAQAGEGT